MNMNNAIRARSQQRDYLLGQLEVWEVAREAGYLPEDVKAFTFRPEFLTAQERRRNRQQLARRKYASYTGADYLNCVRLNNGELKPIPLCKKPIPCNTT